MYKLFISHSTKDSVIVNRFVDLLLNGMNFKQEEIFCSLLYGDLTAGEPFIEAIREAVTGSSAVIFLITEAYLKSSFCLAELGAAWVLCKTIFPLLVPPVTHNELINTPLLGVQCLNLMKINSLYQLGDDFQRKGISSYNSDRFYEKAKDFLEDNSQQTAINRCVPQDNLKLVRYLDNLIEKAKSDDSARYVLAMTYWEGILLPNNNLRATELLTLAATNGYVPAQNILSTLYYTGGTGQQDFNKAFDWLEKAIESERDPMSLDKLAWLYNAGLGCQRDIYKAKKYYIEAIDRNCTNSCGSMGEISEILMDNENAIMWYKKAVEQGDTSPALRLGMIYKNGYGLCPQDQITIIKPDYTQAIHYLNIAAEAGEVEAKYQLGLIYYMGCDMIKKDFANAVKWFRRAAEDGNTHAQYNLAYHYYRGLGVAQDFDQAIFWYERSAAKGHRLARNDVADIFARYERKNYNKALYWYIEAAKQGSHDAHRKLGDFYAFGLGCDEDQIQSLLHYQSAAKLGDHLAQYRLEELAQVN